MLFSNKLLSFSMYFGCAALFTHSPMLIIVAMSLVCIYIITLQKHSSPITITIVAIQWRS